MLLKRIAKAHARNILNRLSDLRPASPLKSNLQWKNKFLGKRCFILGSGMTINNHDLGLLKDEIVMTQNNFFVHPSIKQLSPKFHVVVPHYHPKSEDKKWIEWFQEMDRTLPKDCQLFAGLSSQEMIESNTSFKGRCFYVDPHYMPIALKSAPIDLSKRIIAVQTVLVECLAIAIYMGFESVYLVGFDLDQMCSKNNYGRFYGLSKITDTAAERNIATQLNQDAEIWYFWWTMHLAFDLLRQEARARGVKIANATGAGMLETFDRVNYLDLFSKTKSTELKA